MPKITNNKLSSKTKILKYYFICYLGTDNYCTMRKKINLLIYFFCLFTFQIVIGQDVTLFSQWNGRYDFTFVGNTLNPSENTSYSPSFLYTTSSSTLTLQPNDNVVAAYLYWAGMGTGDIDVKLNNVDFTADILYNTVGTADSLNYFSAYKDITSFVQTTGNGTYTLSELDLNYLIPQYWHNGTHFAGWAILIIYENPSLTLNQINIYQGLETLSPNRPLGILDSKTIDLNNLYLISNTGAKIGFVAWEGDRGIQHLESLKFSANGITNTLSNSLNPSYNAFNGTNTETNSSVLYNMDLDVYSIENYIVPGTTSASVSLESGQDYVMLNTIITKLNSQLPDATIEINNYTTSCNSGNILVDYTVFNVNSTEVLPANTQIGFYIDNQLITTASTVNEIPIGGNESGSILINLPASTTEIFDLIAIVDYNLAVTEINETNNSSTFEIMQWLSPSVNSLENLLSCNLGFTRGTFDFSEYELLVKTNEAQIVSFHETQDEAEQDINEILNTNNYEAQTTPKEIFVRVENDLGCYTITSFQLLTENCPPVIYNAVSADNDGINETFFIEGLHNIFVDYKLEIYNRWGRLIWTGNNSKPDWNGYIEEGIGTKLAPDGTYFYVLHLNDEKYPNALTGYLYLTH